MKESFITIQNDFNIFTIFRLMKKENIVIYDIEKKYIVKFNKDTDYLIKNEFNETEAKKYILSIYDKFPIINILLYKINTEKYIIVDGVQRLIYIYMYLSKHFKIDNKSDADIKKFEIMVLKTNIIENINEDFDINLLKKIRTTINNKEKKLLKGF